MAPARPAPVERRAPPGGHAATGGVSILAWLGQLGFGDACSRATRADYSNRSISHLPVNAAAWLRSSSRAASRLTEQKVT
jgi:hypothetical protein